MVIEIDQRFVREVMAVVDEVNIGTTISHALAQTIALLQHDIGISGNTT